MDPFANGVHGGFYAKLDDSLWKYQFLAWSMRPMIGTVFAGGAASGGDLKPSCNLHEISGYDTARQGMQMQSKEEFIANRENRNQYSHFDEVEEMSIAHEVLTEKAYCANICDWYSPTCVAFFVSDEHHCCLWESWTEDESFYPSFVEPMYGGSGIGWFYTSLDQQAFRFLAIIGFGTCAEQRREVLFQNHPVPGKFCRWNADMSARVTGDECVYPGNGQALGGSITTYHDSASYQIRATSIESCYAQCELDSVRKGTNCRTFSWGGDCNLEGYLDEDDNPNAYYTDDECEALRDHSVVNCRWTPVPQGCQAISQGRDSEGNVGGLVDTAFMLYMPQLQQRLFMAGDWESGTCANHEQRISPEFACGSQELIVARRLVVPWDQNRWHDNVHPERNTVSVRRLGAGGQTTNCMNGAPPNEGCWATLNDNPAYLSSVHYTRCVPAGAQPPGRPDQMKVPVCGVRQYNTDTLELAAADYDLMRYLNHGAGIYHIENGKTVAMYRRMLVGQEAATVDEHRPVSLVPASDARYSIYPDGTAMTWALHMVGYGLKLGKGHDGHFDAGMFALKWNRMDWYMDANDCGDDSGTHHDCCDGSACDMLGYVPVFGTFFLAYDWAMNGVDTEMEGNAPCCLDPSADADQGGGHSLFLSTGNRLNGDGTMEFVIERMCEEADVASPSWRIGNLAPGNVAPEPRYMRELSVTHYVHMRRWASRSDACRFHPDLLHLYYIERGDGLRR